VRQLVDTLSLSPMAQLGPPVSGVYRKGDLIADSAGSIWKCQTSGTPGTWSQMSSSVDEVVTPTTYRGVEGFELFWASVSTIKLGRPGERSIATDASNTILISYVGELTVSVASVGANGRDAGVELPNTWYAVYVIQGSAGVAGLLSTNAVTPTLPAGYTQFRRIGWVRNGPTANFLRFFCSGRKVARDYIFDESRPTVAVLLGGNSTAFATVNFSSLVPPGVERARVSIGMYSKADGDIVGFRQVGSTLTLATCLQQFNGGGKTTSLTSRAVTDTILPLTINAGNGNRELQYAVSNVDDILDIYVGGFFEEV